MKIGCVLMAAGMASRFGSNKLLHEIDGRSLLERSMRAAPVSLFSRAVAVVSDENVRSLAEAAGYRAITNPAPERGQGSTVALGAIAMDGMDAALFCVADQPYLTRESVEGLVSAWQPGDICALSFQGKRGNPILFPSECLSELVALAPEETGRVVLTRHKHRLRLVEAGHARELFDIDTREDLKR